MNRQASDSFAGKIYLFRDQKVMLDRDLAALYGVQTKLRKMLATHEDLKRKIDDMEKRYDETFKIVFEAIKQLFEEDDKSKLKIGYIREMAKSYGKTALKAQLII